MSGIETKVCDEAFLRYQMDYVFHAEVYRAVSVVLLGLPSKEYSVSDTERSAMTMAAAAALYLRDEVVRPEPRVCDKSHASTFCVLCEPQGDES